MQRGTANGLAYGALASVTLSATAATALYGLLGAEGGANVLLYLLILNFGAVVTLPVGAYLGATRRLSASTTLRGAGAGAEVTIAACLLAILIAVVGGGGEREADRIIYTLVGAVASGLVTIPLGALIGKFISYLRIRRSGTPIS